MRFHAVLLAASALFLAVAAQDAVKMLEAATKEATNVGAKFNAISSDIASAYTTPPPAISAFTSLTTPPPAIAAFTRLNQLLTRDLAQMQAQAAPTYSADEQAQIAHAFKDFVDAAQSMLKIVIGKYGVLASPFTPPVAANLRAFEGASDQSPSTAGDMQMEAAALDKTTKEAIAVYSQVGSGIPGINLK
ncbi:hypothetical protein C8R46DRAFT_1041407 [Mycena filopes]|nr:hypothetical protein C8R46DRAFT_1041407 [Mycena filopes]